MKMYLGVLMVINLLNGIDGWLLQNGGTVLHSTHSAIGMTPYKALYGTDPPILSYHQNDLNND